MIHEQTFAVQSGDRNLEPKVLEPADLHEDPILLMAFAADRDSALRERPYCIAGDEFLINGHRVIGFDPPNHGTRVQPHGDSIAGMRNALLAGDDPFAAFAQDVRTVIDHCIDAGLARPGRIAIAGTSRSGYLALRAMAEDDRIASAVAYAPVTDWAKLTEFEDCGDHEVVRSSSLHSFVSELAGRPITLIMGGNDDRVDTASCVRLYELLHAREPGVQLMLTANTGHSVNEVWHQRGAEFTLNAMNTGCRSAV